jgi:hypothetical protein
MRAFIICLLIFACQQRDKKRDIDIPVSNSCSEVQKKIALVQSVIDLPKLQKYYEVQENFGQKFLAIQSGDLIDSAVVLEKFGLPVKVLSKEEIDTRKIQAYIEFKEINIGTDSATVFMKYPVHGIGLKASFKSTDCNWLLLKSSLWEY